MGKELPDNWVEVQLIELLESLENGSRPKGGVQGILDGVPSIGGEHLNSDGGFKFDKIKYVPFDFAEKLVKGKIKHQDVLIVKDGATTGKTSFVSEQFPFKNAYVNEHVFICRSLKEINPKCLFYFLWGRKGQERILDNFTGSAQGGINQKFAKNTLVPLPPLPEQNRIVEKLDAIFGHMEQLKNKLDKIPGLLKNFRQSILNQAVTGKLTQEWRERRELEEWKNNKLETLCKSITDGDHQAPPKVDIGIPFLVISNVSKGFIDFESVTRHVSNVYYESLKSTRKPEIGAILYTVTGSFGIALEIKTNKDFCFQRHIAIIKPDQKKINSAFLHFQLNSSKIFEQANDVATGTAQRTVPLKGLRNFDIQTPPLAEQNEIVNRIESLFTKADKIEQQYQTLKEKIEQLPQAILAKAFKGELVEQLSTDGNARDLLAEIKKARAEMNKTKREHET